MFRVVQLFVILCCLVKLTLALLSCTENNTISICHDDRRQGGIVYVDFSLAPLFEINASCSCFIFAQSDAEILPTYQTSSGFDTIVNTSIQLGEQTFQEASKGFIKLYANSFMKLHFNGDIGTSSPGVCLTFISTSKINIEVVCLPNNNTTVPISGFSTTTNITTRTTFEATTQTTSKTTTHPTSGTTSKSTSRTTTESTFKKTEQPTPSSTEQSSSSTSDTAVIGGAVGGGLLVAAIVMVVVVIMCRRRRLSISQNKEQNINMSVNQTEENPYNVENELYVSADDDILAGGNYTYDVTHLQAIDVNHDKASTTHDVTNNLSDSDNTYDQPDQYNPKNAENMNRCSNDYSVVFKNKMNTPSVDDTDTYDHVNRV